MATALGSFSQLSDQHLLETVRRLAGEERHATAALIRSLMELDARRLYLGEGFPSLFVYCTQVLPLSEHAAYNRIEVARTGRRHPLVLDALESGAITLTTARLLSAHLTEDNCESVLAAARHRNKRGVEELIASLRPLPDVPALVRRLPTPAAAPASGGTTMMNDPSLETRQADSVSVPLPCSPIVHAPPRPVIAPLAPQRYRIQFTASQATHDKLRRAQDLLRHVVPSGDPAEIVDRALTLLLQTLERTRLAAVAHPRPARPVASGSRHIPADVRRSVWHRDAGRCAFVGSRGRCPETGFLEWHHVHPYAMGGAATTENIQLRCRTHNVHEAALVFGEAEPDGDWGRPESP